MEIHFSKFVFASIYSVRLNGCLFQGGGGAWGPFFSIREGLWDPFYEILLSAKLCVCVSYAYSYTHVSWYSIWKVESPMIEELFLFCLFFFFNVSQRQFSVFKKNLSQTILSINKAKLHTMNCLDPILVIFWSFAAVILRMTRTHSRSVSAIPSHSQPFLAVPGHSQMLLVLTSTGFEW